MSGQSPRMWLGAIVLASAFLASLARAIPGEVTGLTATAVTPHSIELRWTPYSGGDFASYEIRRGQAAGVTRSSTLVDSSSSIATSSFTDSNLVAYTTYYYRIFVVDTSDTASTGVETSARTMALYYPHDDPVDSVNINFTAGGTWAIVPNSPGEGDAFTGQWHWSDSPAATYAPNASSSLTLTVNLGTATIPVLSFWQHYSFEPNLDWGFVEVSTDGGTNWTMECFVTGSSASWRQEKIDLSPYRGNPQVMIRFRLQSNSANQSDGWHLDDFEIADVVRQFPYPFADNFDDTTSASNWLSSSWEFVTDGHSPPFQMHDSPIGNYPANAFSSLTLAGTIDLSRATNPVLAFWHKYDLYTNHSYWNEDDWGKVYVSPDNGQVWYLMQSWNGSQADWTKVTIDLRQFVGASAVRVRFTLDDNPNLQNTAQNTLRDGWWVDDVRIEELPTDVALSVTSSSMHHVTLDWTQNFDSDFLRYEVYRATSTSVTRSSTLVASIADPHVTTYTDSVAMIQPTHYSYRVYVVDSLGNASLGSPVVTATYTVPVNSFPFSDSMGAATTAWAWGYPWGPTTAAYHSAPSSWTDSPGASYGRNANTALATVVNLAGATSPVLTFWHRYAFETSVDWGRVEVSNDGGQTWTQVLRVTGIDTTWTRERIDLGKYAGDTIGLRFRLTSDGESQLDGWCIDDVEINNSSRSVAFPWTDDVELGEGSWFADSPWGISTIGSHSGTSHWTDSPAGTYAPNENTSLTLTIDLSGADSPVLRFWEQYSFEPNADWGFVEVSADGGTNWTMEYFLTGSQATWRQDQIDLSPYGGNPQVMIRFRLQSNASMQSDGWHLDDFEIVEDVRHLAYPFTDNFDDTTSVSNWLTSSWELVTDGRSAPYRMHDSPIGNYPANAFSSLTLAGTLDFAGATNPVLTFWHKYDLYTNHSYWNEDDWGKVYVSPDNGRVWYLMQSWAGSQADWTKVTIDLRQFVGASAVRVRFTLDDNPNLQNTAQNTLRDGWWVDDVRIEELPVAVTLSPITSSSMHHATLVWTQNADADFNRYEIYRATSTSVTRSSTLLKTITDRMTTTWTDTFAAVQPTHYSYRIYVVDSLENASLGSNVVTADYTIPLATVPFRDSMNVDTPNWSWGAPWGPTTNSYHSGPASWKTGPDQAYPPNANTATGDADQPFRSHFAGAHLLAPIRLRGWHGFRPGRGIGGRWPDVDAGAQGHGH